MISASRFQVALAAAASAAATSYFVVPYRCVVRDIRAIAQIATSIKSSGATLTATTVNTSNSSAAIGTTAIPGTTGSVAVAALGVYTPNASTGSNVLAAGAVLKTTIAKASASSAAMGFLLDIELDIHALSL
ncbi:MAG: hypothetical protein KAJ18_11670 [Candidatus Omnitrophica bacterium]|nr:hypothetical protein [Candidatus Omnitrophota bacterium]